MISEYLPPQKHKSPVLPAGRRRRAGSRGRSRWQVWLVMVAPLLLGVPSVAGCSSSAPDSPSTSESAPASEASASASSPTAAPSPSAAYKPATAAGPAENVPVPVLPDGAKEFSKAGLEAFSRYWYSTLGYAFETGDPGPMMNITEPSCRPCEVMRQTVIDWHTDGRWIVGGQMFVYSADSSFAQVPDGSYQAITMVRQQQVIYYHGDGSVAEEKSINSAIADIVVARYSDNAWRADTVEHLQGNS